jgi:hypothetical protein
MSAQSQSKIPAPILYSTASSAIIQAGFPTGDGGFKEGTSPPDKINQAWVNKREGFLLFSCAFFNGILV